MYNEKTRSVGMKVFLNVSGLLMFFGIWELVVALGLISEKKLVAPSARL